MDITSIEELFIRLDELTKIKLVRAKALNLRVKLVKSLFRFESNWCDHLRCCERYLIKGQKNPEELQSIKDYISKWLTEINFEGTEIYAIQILRESFDLFQLFLDVLNEVADINESLKSKNWFINTIQSYFHNQEEKKPNLVSFQKKLTEQMKNIRERQLAIPLFNIQTIFPEVFDLEKVQCSMKWFKTIHDYARRVTFQ